MIVEGPSIYEDFRDSPSTQTGLGGKCETHLNAVRKKKKIDLADIGPRPNNPNNALLDFLACQQKFVAKQNNNVNGNNISNNNGNGNGNGNIINNGSRNGSNNGNNNGNNNGDGNNNNGSNNCRVLEKSYASCHASVMGTGNFHGKKHCGDELEHWLGCIQSATAAIAATTATVKAAAAAAGPS